MSVQNIVLKLIFYFSRRKAFYAPIADFGEISNGLLHLTTNATPIAKYIPPFPCFFFHSLAKDYVTNTPLILNASVLGQINNSDRVKLGQVISVKLLTFLQSLRKNLQKKIYSNYLCHLSCHQIQLPKMHQQKCLRIRNSPQIEPIITFDSGDSNSGISDNTNLNQQYTVPLIYQHTNLNQYCVSFYQLNENYSQYFFL